MRQLFRRISSRIPIFASSTWSLKPEQYNPKAREAFGKSLVDIGVGIFKGIMLLLTVAPLTFILNRVIEGSNKGLSLMDFASFMFSPAYFIFIIILGAASYIGYYFRKEGLRHLHELENRSSRYKMKRPRNRH